MTQIKMKKEKEKKEEKKKIGVNITRCVGVFSGWLCESQPVYISFRYYKNYGTGVIYNDTLGVLPSI